MIGKQFCPDLSGAGWLCAIPGILWSRNGALTDSVKAPTPKPVAMRVMLTSWSRFESTTAPKMRSAFGSTMLYITSAASFTCQGELTMYCWATSNTSPWEPDFCCLCHRRGFKFREWSICSIVRSLMDSHASEQGHKITHAQQPYLSSLVRFKFCRGTSGQNNPSQINNLPPYSAMSNSYS